MKDAGPIDCGNISDDRVCARYFGDGCVGEQAALEH
jgi:hypothetical protein